MDSITHILADLLAGMDAQEVMLWRRAVPAPAELLCRVGRPADGALPFPDVENGFAGTRFTEQGHLALAALDAPGGLLVIAARRDAPFGDRDAKALRSVLHALAVSKI
ncbi:hypothetical protein [Falsiroseomonas bella]|uniref:hypothetical protein n=1 Tax=Falsiroseomonas bella TaxID=2184016 RepID=UPI0011B700EA|nr:hypothetical protein [Falsiroseomonas bella]